MVKPMRKSTFRDIKGSLGRYIAIILIIALGIGFFVGLRMTEPSMVATAQDYLDDKNLYDFQLLSTLGFTKEDVEVFSDLEGIESVGAYETDVVTEFQEERYVTKVHSITEDINELELISGRMPDKANECVVDAEFFSSEMIGEWITITKDSENHELLAEESYLIVGTVDSPLYLNFERGTTTIGNGTISHFMYVTEEGFDLEYYTSVYLDADAEGTIYSKEYEENVDDYTNVVEEKLEEQVEERFEALQQAVMAGYIPADQVTEPEAYVLDRESNVGYVCFENDSAIVAAISVVFPVFFFLVAALVCMTTMHRMIDESRGQLGTLKALGYTNGEIYWKFLVYSGSGAVIGWLLGYGIGSFTIPFVIWNVYGIMYGFAPLKLVFNPGLFVLCLLVALLCSCGVTYLGCRRELRPNPATLMRPKAPKAGKKILLERIPFLWKRMSFFAKVSVRNIFRFKNRLVMMVIGIGGCTALLIAGFGVQDSIQDVVHFQYNEIMLYDYGVTLSVEDEAIGENVAKLDGVKEQTLVMEQAMEFFTEDNKRTKSANVIVAKEGQTDGFIDLHKGEETLDFPKENEILISQSLAALYQLEPGDMVALKDGDGKEAEFKVGAVFDNYIYHYVVMSDTGYEDNFEKDAEYKQLYVKAEDGEDLYELGTAISEVEGVLRVSNNQEMIDRMENTLSSIDYIVIMIVIFAAMLAFVVIFNLTNINIIERVREIATIKVLGFFSGEVITYVFREILWLTFGGVVVGVLLGKSLHTFVMAQIKVDLISFQNRIDLSSYLIAVGLTFLFAGLIELVMRKRLDNIDMAQSLKSVE